MSVDLNSAGGGGGLGVMVNHAHYSQVSLETLLREINGNQIQKLFISTSRLLGSLQRYHWVWVNVNKIQKKNYLYRIHSFLSVNTNE